jgi:hypothetical protein
MNSGWRPSYRLLTPVLLVLLGSCTDSKQPAPEPPEPVVPAVAKVLCTEEGPRVETPVVRAQSDGVHFRITNETNDKTLFSTGGGPETGPLTEGEHANVVSAVPPGESEVGCRRPDLRLKEYASIEVLDPEGWWTPGTELECVSGSIQATIFGSARDESPLSQATELLKGVRPDDVVREAGYPGDSEAIVTVARDGRVIMVVSFSHFDMDARMTRFDMDPGTFREGLRWVLQGATSCSDDGVGLDL